MASEEGTPQLPECGDSIDAATFEQILEMDDDEDEREFSKSITFGFFEQAETTFQKMDKDLEQRDLASLSGLGHFLKGSSATLGLTHIKNSCEKIQHLGMKKDETGNTDETEDYCLTAIRAEVVKLRKEYVQVETALRKFYGEADPDP